MKLTKIGQVFVWDGDYTTRHLPKAAKFRWFPGGNTKYPPPNDIPEKSWYTTSLEHAILLSEYADDSCRQFLIDEKSRRDGNLMASMATDVDEKLPVPTGLEYYGYQKVGISYALRNRNVLIADEMGLGKTIQAIGVINADTTIRRVLIVTPASLKYNWEKELDMWLTRKLSIQRCDSKSKLLDVDIHIINYDILAHKSMAKLVTSQFDLVIADEAHYVKNPKTKRSTAFYQIKTNRLIMLTGTPILNRPVELFPIISHLGFGMEYWPYVTRYCDAQQKKYGWDVSGASNLDELQLKLRESIMIRRLKADVLHDLPAKQRQIIYLDPDKYSNFIDKEAMIANGALRSIIESEYDVNDDGENVDDFETGVSIMSGVSASDIASIAVMRHHLAIAKLPDVVEHLNSLLTDVDKIVVFAHHRDVITGIYDTYRDMAVKLDGGMSADDRNESVNRFQTDPNIRVFVGSIKAAGVGITLTSANTVVFVESDWVPANLTQAEDRCHRIGQTDSVLVQHVVVDGSIDANLVKRIVAKQNVIDRALNVEHAIKFKEDRLLQIERAKEATEQQIAEQRKLVEAAKQESVDRKRELSKSGHSDAVRNYVLRCVKRLASSCNGATTEDGVGFNKFDVAFGHSLANRSYLTDRQVEAAIKMLRKYSRQLGGKIDDLLVNM